MSYPPGMQIVSVHHIGIRVTDEKRAVEFYESFGFRLVYRDGVDPVVILKNDHGVELNLIVNAALPFDGKNPAECGRAAGRVARRAPPVAGRFRLGARSAADVGASTGHPQRGVRRGSLTRAGAPCGRRGCDRRGASRRRDHPHGAGARRRRTTGPALATGGLRASPR